QLSRASVSTAMPRYSSLARLPSMKLIADSATGTSARPARSSNWLMTPPSPTLGYTLDRRLAGGAGLTQAFVSDCGKKSYLPSIMSRSGRKGKRGPRRHGGKSSAASEKETGFHIAKSQVWQPDRFCPENTRFAHLA